MKKIIISIIIVIMLTLITTITLKIMYNNNKLEIEIQKNNIEVYANITLKEIINENINIINDYKIDTTKIGEQTLEVKYKNKIFTYKEFIKINIIDKESPIVLVSNITLEQGQNIDLVNNFLCGDNYDARPNCYIEGDYNINEPGKYNLKYIAVDSSNNKTEKNFTLTIYKQENKKENKQQIIEQYTDFKDVIKKYKTNNTKIGIDVSKWQGNIDFEAVKNAGCEFVIIKAAGTYIDQELYVDPSFVKNIENAKKNNLKVGVYLNSKAKTKELAQKEINYILDLIKDYDIELGIAYDWENFKDFNSYNISIHDLNEMATIFLEESKNHGYKPILYSSQYYLENIWNVNYNTWIARYSNINTYEGDYIMWQLCNDGKIDGILGYVDIDILYE